jgi:hypothetical protein
MELNLQKLHGANCKALGEMRRGLVSQTDHQVRWSLAQPLGMLNRNVEENKDRLI